MPIQTQSILDRKMRVQLEKTQDKSVLCPTATSVQAQALTTKMLEQLERRQERAPMSKVLILPLLEDTATVGGGSASSTVVGGPCSASTTVDDAATSDNDDMATEKSDATRTSKSRVAGSRSSGTKAKKRQAFL